MSESLKRYCAMPSCKGEKMDLVHKFPRNDERAREWIRIVNLPELFEMPLNKIRTSKFICTRHFAPEAYKHAESRSLNINAVPSRNLDRLETLDHIIQRERKGRNAGQSHISDSENENEKAINYFAVDRQLEQKGHEEEEIMILPVKKKLTPELKLTPVKRLKFTPATVQLWERTGDESPPIQIDIMTDIMSSDSQNEVLITNTLDEVLQEEVLEEEPIVVTEEPRIDFLEIEDDEKYPLGIRLHYFWLRDHCQCDKCYDKDTAQRKFTLTDINLDIRPSDYNIHENRLRVKWPDGHESFYELDFLYNSQYLVRRQIYEQTDSVLWNQELIQTMDYARVDLSELLCSENAVKIVLASLVKYGVAFINKVPATQHSTEMTITRLFPLMKTFFGEMWTFSDTKDHHDSAYTNNYLPAHNDNTYFNDAAGLQILHCIQHNGEGGDNFLVDGFNVVSELKKEYPETFHRLTEYQIPSEYIEEGRHHRHTAPIIKLNSLTGSPEQLRFNMNDRAVLDTIPFDKIQAFYADLHILSTEIQKKSNSWSFKLNPGTVLIFDNWRVLHGRNEYTGKRTMTGAYVLKSEFLSAARVAGVIS